MLLRRTARFVLVVAMAALLLGVVATSTNVVAQSRAGSRTAPRPSANQLKPPQCAALNLTGVVTGSGSFSDDDQPHLVLGSGGIDLIRGRGGTDCILGGGGFDVLVGDAGSDICIGGPGLDVFLTCETQIQ